MADASRSSILVVEDNLLMADMVAGLVQRAGFDVAGPCGQVAEALQLVAKGGLAGAVVDLNLHGDLSLPICWALSRRRIPYAFLTAYADPWIVPPGLRGARWLAKPVDPAALTEALQGFARQGDRRADSSCDSGNIVLDELAQEHWEAIKPNLRQITLTAGDVVEEAGKPVSHLYFPISATIAIFTGGSSGARIETGIVGAEGVTGTGTAVGVSHSAGDAIVRTTGAAWRAKADDIALDRPEWRALRECITRFALSFQAQSAETALFTGKADIEHRLARWLLALSVRQGSSVIEVTHEAIAEALAVRRAGITTALHQLKSRHLIDCRRRSIELLDQAGLLNQVHQL